MLPTPEFSYFPEKDRKKLLQKEVLSNWISLIRINAVDKHIEMPRKSNRILNEMHGRVVLPCNLSDIFYDLLPVLHNKSKLGKIE